MKPVFTTITTLCLLFWTGICIAYEPGTHQNLADASAQTSVLVKNAPGLNSTVLQDLGLPSYIDGTKNLWFLDSQPGLTIDLGPDGSPYTTPVTGNAQALIQAGAAIEDDEYRSFCHFYDPSSGQPLQVLGQVASHSDPDWASGEDASGEPISGACSITVHVPLINQDVQLGQQTQQYSLLDANSYFYAALTSPNLGDRSSNFGDLFLSLGHALHLLQDMAQPQHVRNDMHCDNYKCIPIGQYHPSKYERDVFGLPYNITVQGNYTPDFPTERGFWTGGYKGLADFTNQNFLSVGTLDWVDGSTVGYSSPVLGAADTEEDVTAVYQQDLGNKPVPYEIAQFCNSQPNSCKLEFHSTTGTDSYTGGSVLNPKAASESIFNADLTDFGSHKVYTLNIVTEESAWNLLQPMAVGYGTGMINHFFRGRLGVQPDPSNADNYIVSNLSGYELKGTVQFYYDDKYGSRFPIKTSATTVDLAAYSSGQPPASKSISVVLPAYPQTQASGSFMAVFNGTIGTEPGIAGKYFIDGFYLLDDDYQSYYGLARQYTTGGEFINELSLGVPEAYEIRLAASGGSVFAAGYFPDGPNGAAVPVVVRDGGSIVRYPADSFVDDLALNDKYLFVAAESTDTSEPIYEYDLDGNPVDLNGNPITSPNPPPVLTVPIPLVTGMGANDKVMCVTGLDSNGNAEDLLYKLAPGAQGTQLNAGSTIGDECAATSDRVYVARNLSNGGVSVDVYGNDGNPITTFSVDGETESFGIAATDRQVYVEIFDYHGAVTPGNPTGYEQGVAVYQRDPTTDTFSSLPKIWVSPDNGRTITRDIAVDVKAVIANGDH